MGQVTRTHRFTRDRLRPYQAREVERLAAGESRALFWQPGAGKTAVVLQAIAARFGAGVAGRALIVSTPTVVSTVWETEIGNWAETAGTAYYLIRGTPKQRAAIFQAFKEHNGPAIAAIGFDSAHTLEATPIDILVVDEASLARTTSSRRFLSLIQIAARSQQRIVLTGSPAPNSATDVFGPVALVDLGACLGTRFSAFRDSFTVKTGHKAWHRRDRHDAREKIADMIRHLSTSLTTADVTEIPPLQRVLTPVEIGDRAKEIYDALENEALNLVTADTVKPDAFLIKAQQVANGFVYDETGTAHRVHDAKLDAVTDIVEPILAGRGQVIVVYQFRADLEALRARWPKLAVLGSQDATGRPEDIVKAWGAGKIDVLALHPRSAGHGVNLQHNARCADLIWLTPTWSSELFEQTNARIHRPGQVNHIRVHVVVARDTIDEAVVAILDRKVSAQAVLMALLKERAAAQKAETRDYAVQLREARLAAARAHPDAGGTSESFREAWARYQALLQKA
jgi:SNF2 family DNA or RNA helicase